MNEFDNNYKNYIGTDNVYKAKTDVVSILTNKIVATNHFLAVSILNLYWA